MIAALRVRVASAADIPIMHRIRRSVRENRLSRSTTIVERSYVPFTRSRSIWVAEWGGEVAGFGAVDARRNRVWALFVDPAFEGRGIGQALHQSVIDWAQDRRVGRLSLSTGRDTRAEGFYRRHGWIEMWRSDEGEVEFQRVCRARPPEKTRAA